MQEDTRPKVNNLKVHLLLTKSGVKKLEYSLLNKEKKTYNNFHVLKNERFTYIIFPKKGFINVTGIPNFGHLKSVTPQLCDFFGLKADDVASDVIIDNISASGNFGRRVNLTTLQTTVNGKGGEIFVVQGDRNIFPGSFCKTRKLNTKGFGTLTLFSSGSYVLVGCRSMEDVEKAFQHMSAVMKMLPPLEKTSLSAFPVG